MSWPLSGYAMSWHLTINAYVHQFSPEITGYEDILNDEIIEVLNRADEADIKVIPKPIWARNYYNKAEQSNYICVEKFDRSNSQGQEDSDLIWANPIYHDEGYIVRDLIPNYQQDQGYWSHTGFIFYNYTAEFHIKVADNTTNAVIGTVKVYDVSDGETELASVDIIASEENFPNLIDSHPIYLEFDLANRSGMEVLENSAHAKIPSSETRAIFNLDYRIYWNDTQEIWADRVEVYDLTYEELAINENYDSRIEQDIQLYTTNGAENNPYQWYLMDEPSIDQIPGMKYINDILEENNESGSSFLNFLPNYAAQHQYESVDFGSYIQETISELNLATYSFDHYPFFWGDGNLLESFYPDLSIHRTAAQMNGKDFWYVPQAGVFEFASPVNDFFTSRLTVYSSLAYGAKGIFWWRAKYQLFNPVDDDDLCPEEWPEGTTDYTTCYPVPVQPAYNDVKEINRTLELLGSDLLQLNSISAFYLNDDPNDDWSDQGSIDADSYVYEIDEIDYDITKVIVGSFEHDVTGQPYIMIVNLWYEDDETRTFTVTLDDCDAGRMIEDLLAIYDAEDTNQEIYVLTSEENTFTITLGPGEGRLFRITENVNVVDSDFEVLSDQTVTLSSGLSYVLENVQLTVDGELIIPSSSNVIFSSGSDLIINGQVTIEEGAVLEFADGSGIEVYGALDVNDDATDPAQVIFTSLSDNWEGVYLDNGSFQADNIVINNVTSYAVQGINNSIIDIENASISNCTDGIYSDNTSNDWPWSTVTIKSSEILGNSTASGYGIYTKNQILEVEKTLVHNYSIGIYCEWHDDTYSGSVRQNLINQTTSWGNTVDIIYYGHFHARLELTNTIYNVASLESSYYTTDYCYTSDPGFVDESNDDFYLQWSSPCINAGDPNSPADPDGSPADLGYMYRHLNLGDVNDDEEWDVLDNVRIVAFIIESIIPNNAEEWCADINSDGVIDVLDVVALIDCISENNCDQLNKSNSAEYSGLITFSSSKLNNLSRSSDHSLILSINTDVPIRGLQVDIEFDANQFSLTDIEQAEISTGLSLEYNETDEGIVRLILYPEDMYEIPAGEHEILYVNFGGLQKSAGGNIVVGLNNPVVSGRNGTRVNVDHGTDLPTTYSLHPAYPNPFNPETTVKFDLPQDSKVSLKIYDIMGREVAALLNDYQLMQAGYHSIVWNASGYSSGTYLIKMIVGDHIETQKLMCLFRKFRTPIPVNFRTLFLAS